MDSKYVSSTYLKSTFRIFFSEVGGTLGGGTVLQGCFTSPLSLTLWWWRLHGIFFLEDIPYLPNTEGKPRKQTVQSAPGIGVVAAFSTNQSLALVFGQLEFQSSLWLTRHPRPSHQINDYSIWRQGPDSGISWGSWGWRLAGGQPKTEPGASTNLNDTLLKIGLKKGLFRPRRMPWSGTVARRQEFERGQWPVCELGHKPKQELETSGRDFRTWGRRNWS